MKVRILDAAGREAAEVCWRHLHERLDPQGVTTSWEWAVTWLEQWGDRVDHWFVLAESEAEPMGVALLTRELPPLAPLRGRALHIGTAGEPARESVFVERNKLLCPPAHRTRFCRLVLEAATSIPGWERLVIDGFVVEDADELRALAPRLSLRVERSPCRDLAKIRDAAGDVHSSLRSGVRRRVRQSERGFGPLTVDWAEREDDALDILEELVRLHRERWARDGETTAFVAGATQEFHRALIGRLLPLGRIALIRVRNDEGTVGCLLCHVDRNDVLFYQSGFPVFEDNRLRPGLVTHVAAMQACLERGFDVYDFLVGDARYKDELSDCDRALAWGTMWQRGPRARTAQAAHHLWDRSKRRPAEN